MIALSPACGRLRGQASWLVCPGSHSAQSSPRFVAAYLDRRSPVVCASFSEKLLRVILSYTDAIRLTTWRETLDDAAIAKRRSAGADVQEAPGPPEVGERGAHQGLEFGLIIGRRRASGERRLPAIAQHEPHHAEH
jgi:hypothetical protein